MKKILIFTLFLVIQLTAFAITPKNVSGTILGVTVKERVSIEILSDRMDKDYTMSARVDEMIVIKNVEIVNGVEVTTIVTL